MVVVVKKANTRVVRNSLISAAVLLVLLVGGGVAYTYFMGPDSVDTAAPAAATSSEDMATIKPTKPSPDAVESASIQALTTPVAPGENASVAIKTVAGSKCKISVIYGTVASTDSGLMPKVADDYGTVSWAWTVGASVPLGSWPVKIDCQYNTKSAMVQDKLVVAKPTQP